jgi:ADP-glucose pyrophosphorylase
VIESFREKPSQTELEQFMSTTGRPTSDVMRPFTASMGVYVFKREALLSLLHTNEVRSDPPTDTKEAGGRRIDDVIKNMSKTL